MTAIGGSQNPCGFADYRLFLRNIAETIRAQAWAASQWAFLKMQSFIASKTSSECWLMVVAIVMVSWTTDFVVLAAKSPIGDSGVQSVFFQQTRLNEANLYADRVFHVLNNMMNSTNLTFVINCVNKDYFR